MKADFEYTNDGFWIRLYPNNEQAIEAFNHIINQTGESTWPSHWLPSIKEQLKKAGYSIRKMRAKKFSKSEIDKLLNELNS